MNAFKRALRGVVGLDTRQPGTYTVLIHEDHPAGFWAEVRELPGCFASGDDLQELTDSLAEAMTLYLAPHPATTPRNP